MKPMLTGSLRAGSLIAWMAVVGSITLTRPQASGEVARQDSCRVTLANGDVQGVDLGASCAFLGIPYAASPGGINRWKPPQSAAPWAPVVLSATMPPQNCRSLSVFGGTPTISGSEDCLKLNVWLPDPPPDTPAPVIVWLHTGAFIGASANFAGSNGGRLAAETGTIVVAPNYRVGAFGFLFHRALAAESGGVSGNYGLLDQREALRWVRDNIAHFGGDPDNVTLAGTSAGGQSVGLHLVSPGSRGLFHRASVQSAYPTSRWTTPAEAAIQGDAFAAGLGCTNPSQVLACMRSAATDAVVLALGQATQQVLEPATAVYWEPVVDGVVIPDQPRSLFERGDFHQVPTIVGFTRDEGWGAFVTRSFSSGVSLDAYLAWLNVEFGSAGPAIADRYPADLDPVTPVPSPIEALARVAGDAQFVCEGVRLARLIERTGTPTYLYSYEHVIDTLSPGHVIHGVESNIQFGNNYAPPVFPAYVLNTNDLALHAAMSGYWTRFAATGNPNTDDESVVRWPAFKHPSGRGRGADKFIVFANPIAEGMRHTESNCEFFATFFNRSILSGVPASTP